jgi:hypothetical protein
MLDAAAREACHVGMGDEGGKVPGGRRAVRPVERADSEAEHRQPVLLGVVARRGLAESLADTVGTIGPHGHRRGDPRHRGRVEAVVVTGDDAGVGLVALVESCDVV